jgi:tetratricopeptide (TPR) repeat protein
MLMSLWRQTDSKEKRRIKVQSTKRDQKGTEMKTSRAREGNSSKKMIISGAVAILATLCITLNSLPMTAEGSADVQDDQHQSGLKVHLKLELTKTKQVLSQLALAYVKIANAYSDHAQYELGIPWANKALRLDPTLPEAHLISGWLNQRVRNMGTAIAAYEKTIELDPSNFDAHLYLGVLYIGRSDPSLGIDYLNQALQVAPTPEDRSIAYTHRGHAYSVMERYEEAFADLDTALSIDPDNCLAVWIQGVVSEVVAERENPVSNQEADPGMGQGIGFGS